MTALEVVSGRPVEARAADLIAGWEALIRMAHACPEIADHPGFAQAFSLMRIPVHGDDASAAVSQFVRAAGEAGGDVEHDIVGNETWAAIVVRLGPAVALWVYGSRTQLGDGPLVEDPEVSS